ncbi:MAG: chemotaxis protein CheW [Candidatus Caenarcaniphilales bacterium]|nr:chemotaxis protein CheW [Candidatus Caenarcaniphilales bacterium]
MSKDNHINESSQQFIIFQLANETMGIPIGLVREVINLKSFVLSRIPGSPTFCSGVINLRGQVIPIIDARKRYNFGLDLPLENDPKAIILENNKEQFGLMVDEVEEVADIPPEAIESAPGHMSSGLDRDRKIGRISGKNSNQKERFVFLLSRESLFNDTGATSTISSLNIANS